MRRIAVAVAFVGAAAGGTAAAAGADVLECGSVVTTDVVLTQSLTGCVDVGLVVGANGVTIDLNGHSIDGLGTSTSDRGVIVGAGVTGATVRNGRIRGFRTGIGVSQARNTLVEKVTVQDASTGISVWESEGVRLIGNAVASSRLGIGVQWASFVHLESNRTSGLFWGVEVRFSRQTSLIGNDASENSSVGIFLEESAGLFERNTANANGGTGFLTFNNHGRYLNNVTNANGGHGLYVWDQAADHGHGFTIGGHVANANAGLGILSSMDGVVDGGKNRARANGDSRQCVRIACS